jgi:hypothetical protein
MSEKEPLASFATFLRTGMLGQLDVHMDEQQVLELLGEPEGTFRPDWHKSHTYMIDGETFTSPPLRPGEEVVEHAYGSLLITFLNGEMAHYVIDFKYTVNRPTAGLPALLTPDWYHTVKGWDDSAFKSFLKSNNLRCKQVVLPREEGVLLILDDAKIEVAFHPDDQFRIWKIVLSGMVSPDNWQVEFEKCW